MYDPELVILWIGATMHIKNVGKSANAAKGWARLFGYGMKGQVSSGALLRALQHVSIRLLRDAGIKLDCTAMVIFRSFFAALRASIDEHELHIYVYADASPQWRGLELLASSFECTTGDGKYYRRLFPLVSLSRDMVDAAAVGNALALTWKVVLSVGRLEHMVRFFQGACCNHRHRGREVPSVVAGSGPGALRGSGGPPLCARP